LNRIFADSSDGAQAWFDYPQNLDRARDYFERYEAILEGQPPRTTLAVWHPTLDHWFNPKFGWSQPAWCLADALREHNAFEVVDDRMILDGALKNLGVRQLVLVGADWLDRLAWQAVHGWVKKGGVLIVLQSKSQKDIEGDDTLWRKQSPEQIPFAKNALLSETDAQCEWRTEELWEKGSVRMGKGIVLTLDAEGLSDKQKASLVQRICEEAGTHVGKPAWNAKRMDNGSDGVLTTLFDDKILYYNTGSQSRSYSLKFREGDFPPGSARPGSMDLTLEIPSRTIVSVPLVRQD